MQQPIIIEVTRGDYLESRHQVIAIVTDSQGKRVHEWGNAEQLVFPRSTAKPLQAMPLVLSGAADALQLNNKQLAMACSSHNGEEQHAQVVNAWLKQLNMDDQALECGSHWPMHEPATLALAKSGSGIQACPVHNNCSGKHCGFLSLAYHRGIEHQGYIKAEHAIQQEVNSTMGEIMGVNVFDHPMGIDGCSIPTYALPLPALAMGFARFGSGQQLPEGWAAAAKTLYDAMVAEPFYVAGSQRHCTHVMQAFGDQVACKTGAEGVFGAAIPSLGLGVAIKAIDGNSRAAEVALNYVLDTLGLQAKDPSFTQHIDLYNRNQMQVGQVRLAKP
ncbi:MAG TPA: asparaginase [Oceanospirillaceae bacterium]|nr:asparaginase [Oceanospirillaceae bacterium]